MLMRQRTHGKIQHDAIAGDATKGYPDGTSVHADASLIRM